MESAVSLRFAVLIDWGFLKYKLSTSNKLADADTFRAFVNQRLLPNPKFEGMRLHRIYFYDATPFTESVPKPLGGDSVDFNNSPTAQRGKKLHADLAQDAFMAMRLGDLVCNGWEVKKRVLKKNAAPVTIGPDDLAPVIQQKGVDMRIAMDMAALTLKKHVEVLVLVSGDSDFVPAMKFARREGAQVYLVTLGHGIRAAMREHCDLVLDV